MVIKRLLAVGAAALLGIAGLVLLGNPANASAGGCTLAPGYTGALNCIDVYGSGQSVTSSRSTYEPGYNGLNENLCNRQHQWRYTPNGKSQTSRTVTAPGCILGYLNDYVDWSSPGTMAHGSSFCARTNNTQTGGTWSNYACETIG